MQIKMLVGGVVILEKCAEVEMSTSSEAWRGFAAQDKLHFASPPILIDNFLTSYLAF